MKKIIFTICFILTSLMVNAEDNSLANHFLLGANVGLPGGPEIKAGYRLTDYLEISATYRFFEYERDVDNIQLNDGGSLSGTIKYDPSSAGLFISVYPFGDDLKITAGRYFNAGTLEGNVIGNPTVKVDNIGTTQTVNVRGSAELNIGDNVTYLALGYNLGVTDRFHLEFNAGVQLIKEPELDIKLNTDEASLDTVLNSLDNGSIAITNEQKQDIKNYLAAYGYDLTEIEAAAADAGYTLPADINVSSIEQEAKDEVKKAYRELPRWGSYRLLPSVSIGFVYFF